MKTNIKMRVTPEQSRKVQEICFDKGILLGARKIIRHLNIPFLFIDNNITGTDNESFYQKDESEEIDADLFIRTNGTCEETFKEQQSYNDSDLIIKDDNIHMIGKAINKHNEIKDGINEWAKQFNDIEQKLKKKNEILKKARIKRKNQREELHKLNLKLQKCISFEEHHQVVDELRKDINFRNETIKNTFQISKDRLKEIEQLKAENIEMGKLVNLNKSALDLAVITKELAMNEIERKNKERKNKEIKKLKAVIELRNKPFRDFSIAVDNLAKAIVECIPNKIIK